MTNRSKTTPALLLLCTLAGALILAPSASGIDDELAPPSGDDESLGTIYYTTEFLESDNEIRVVKEDGSGSELFYTTLATAIAVDADRGRMYWTSGTGVAFRSLELGPDEAPSLSVANSIKNPVALDIVSKKGEGVGFNECVTPRDPDPTPSCVGPYRLFWVNPIDVELGYSTFPLFESDSNSFSVAFENSVGTLTDLAAERSSKTVYWSTDGGPLELEGVAPVSTFASIQWDNGVAKTVALTGRIERFAIDPVAERVYWTDRYFNTVRRANLDGTEQETFYDSADDLGKGGIDIDVEGGRVYWGEEVGNGNWQVVGIDLDGDLASREVVSEEQEGRIGDLVFVPEPAASLLAAVSLAGLGLLTRQERARRKHRAWIPRRCD